MAYDPRLNIMDRVPEPELMDDAEQAHAYAEADFSEPHQAFVDRFAERFDAHRPQRVLDLGCGPADVTIRFARAHPGCAVLGIDGAPAMLALGRRAVERAGLASRVTLALGRLPAPLAAGRDFDTVISNSLLHHLADPMALWRAVGAHAAPGAAVFIMDLIRPQSHAHAEQLVARHAAGEPEILRCDFRHSLLAAYRPEEVEQQLRQSGLPLRVEVVSDRHLVAYGHAAR